ncbi:MAG: hypothetical protein ACI9JM_001536 [Halioglobus sp.]|jgi:hypothetical protein
MTHKTVKRAVTLLLVCGLLSACTQWRWDLGAPVPLSAQAESQSFSTLSEALELLGPPITMSATSNGFVMAWEHWKIREDSVGVRLGVIGADFVNIDWGETQAMGEFLLLNFDREHRLTSSSYYEWDDEAGSGMAVQPLFSFVSVVNSDDLRDQLTQHYWGGDLLQELPKGLNRQSSPYTGQNGLQQRGTPGAVGQRTLEMD